MRSVFANLGIVFFGNAAAALQQQRHVPLWLGRYQDNEVIPAWVFGTEDAFFEPVYINAITGDKLLVI